MALDALFAPDNAGALPRAPRDLDLFLSTPTPAVLELARTLSGPVLVLGAGGKMGLHVSLMLRRAFDAVRSRERLVAVSRFGTLRDRAAFAEHGIEARPADLSDPAALRDLPEAGTIFYLAGVKFGTALQPGLLQAANVALPAIVAERFRRARIVAFSSGCVYPFTPPASGGAHERTPLGPVGEYAESCVQREAAFTRASLVHGTPVTLVRLNYSVEFRYGVLVDIAQKVRGGEPVDVTMGHLNAIWQRDAVAHILQSARLAACPPAPINITGPDVLRVRDLAQRFGQLLDRPVVLVGHEADTALLSNAAESVRRFGRPATSVDQMMRWIAAWLRDGGETWGKPTGFEVRDGRF